MSGRHTASSTTNSHASGGADLVSESERNKDASSNASSRQPDLPCCAGRVRPLQEVARGDRIGEVHEIVLEGEDLPAVETHRIGHRDIRREFHRKLARLLQYPIVI